MGSEMCIRDSFGGGGFGGGGGSGGSGGAGGGAQPPRIVVDASSAGPVEHFALEAEVRREQWEAMADLDTFFARVYGYFRERGLRCILLARVTSVLMLVFTLLASYCAAELVNWHDLLYECTDERSCLQASGAAHRTAQRWRWRGRVGA